MRVRNLNCELSRKSRGVECPVQLSKPVIFVCFIGECTGWLWADVDIPALKVRAVAACVWEMRSPLPGSASLQSGVDATWKSCLANHLIMCAKVSLCVESVHPSPVVVPAGQRQQPVKPFQRNVRGP